jgi:glycosyltransferase involved in cell wall biosynthesis
MPRPQPARAAAKPALPGLVVFSPLPPMPTGIGDYTYELLPSLATHYTCTVIAEDGIPDLTAPPGIRLLRLRDYLDQAEAFAADVHLYMVGNNPDHLYLLPTLASHPGVVVLHDPGLHHLLDCATASLGDAEGYCAAVEAEYGAPGRLLADQWRQHELRDRQMLYDMPMLRHLLGPAKHVIVHSRFAAHKALAQAPDTPVTIAPHQYAPPAIRRSRAELRARLGIGADEVVFLSLGFVSHIKRIDSAMRALARIAGRLPPFRYVIAGELRPDELDVARLARTLGLTRQVLTTGYVADQDFFGMLDMADVVINLRYPVGGETSGTLIRALGSGACVVVVDAGPFAEIPDGAAIKLPWGPRFEADLSDTLLRLAISPAARNQIGARAAEEIGRRNSPAATIAAYRAAIDAAAAVPPRPWRCTATVIHHPPQRPPQSGAPLWQRLDAVPRLSPTGATLAIGDPADLAALTVLGHQPTLPHPGWQRQDGAERDQDMVFLNLGPTSPLLAEATLLRAVNHRLRFGGVLVLTVTGIPPRGHPLAARATGIAAFRAAGYRVELAAAAAPPTLTGEALPEPDAVVWRAIKLSEFAAPTLTQAA